MLEDIRILDHYFILLCHLMCTSQFRSSTYRSEMKKGIKLQLRLTVHISVWRLSHIKVIVASQIEDTLDEAKIC